MCLLSQNLCCRVLPITGCFLLFPQNPRVSAFAFSYWCYFRNYLLGKRLSVDHFCCLHSVEYKCRSVRSETFACGMCEQNVLVGRVPVLPYMWPAVNKQVVQAVQAVQAVHNKTISPNQRYHFQCKLEHSPFSYM